jgi:hypothetical protein
MLSLDTGCKGSVKFTYVAEDEHANMNEAVAKQRIIGGNIKSVTFVSWSSLINTQLHLILKS